MFNPALAAAARRAASPSPDALVGRDPIELRERIQALADLLIVREGKGEHLDILLRILEALSEEQFMGYQRAFEIQAGRGRLQPTQMPTADAELRQRDRLIPTSIYRRLRLVSTDTKPAVNLPYSAR